MASHSRRGFMGLAVLAPLAAAAHSHAVPPIRRKGRPHVRPALNAWCGALVDTGTYLTDDPYADIAMMVPHAVNWQIKETLGSSLKTPPTDYRRLVRIIHDGGYRGFVPIETLAMGRKDYDPAAEIVKSLESLRDAIAALG